MMAAHILVIFLCVTMAFSWVIPRDLADGMYHVELPDNANEISGSPAIAEYMDKEESSFERRGFGETRKGVVPGGPPLRYSGQVPQPMIPVPIDSYDCQFNAPPLSLVAYDYARESFEAYCDNYGIAPKTKHISLSKWGDVVVFMCNTDDKVNWCERSEFEWVEQNVLNRHCGQLTAAWGASISAHKVYGRAWKGMNICEEETLRKTTWVGTPDYMLSPEIPINEPNGVIHEWRTQLEAGSDPIDDENPGYGKPLHPVPKPGHGTSEISSGTSEDDDSEELGGDSSDSLPHNEVAEKEEEDPTSDGDSEEHGNDSTDSLSDFEVGDKEISMSDDDENEDSDNSSPYSRDSEAV